MPSRLTDTCYMQGEIHIINSTSKKRFYLMLARLWSGSFARTICKLDVVILQIHPQWSKIQAFSTDDYWTFFFDQQLVSYSLFMNGNVLPLITLVVMGFTESNVIYTFPNACRKPLKKISETFCTVEDCYFLFVYFGFMAYPPLKTI